MILALVAASTAFAWNQAIYVHPQTNAEYDVQWPSATVQATYRINTNDFSSAEVAAIVDGADAWHGGSGTVIRGVNWEFVRGADTSSDGTHGNGVNNVRVRPYSEVEAEANGSDNALAVATMDYSCLGGVCLIDEFDISFSDDVSFHAGPPNDDPSLTDKSLGQVAMHEFGHAVGLGHESHYAADDIVATMNPQYPCGGDTSGLYRISEDDYLGMRNLHPGGSTGRNLMLNRFSNERLAPGHSEEIWTSANGSDVENGNTWCSIPGGYIYSQNTPSMITVLMTGTTASVTANVKWRLNVAGTCNDGDEYTIDSRSFTIGVNAPFRPTYVDWTLPNNVPVGDYQLCAVIDAANAVSETVEVLDNDARSEKTFRVRSSLAACP